MDITSYLLGKKKGGVTPTGEVDITQNGVHNVSGYATANVQVPEPTGNINITDTNVTNVKDYTTAQVVDTNLIAGNIKKDVTVLGITGTLEQGVFPTGTIGITENGTVDVTNYASAEVNVSSAGVQEKDVNFYDYDGTLVYSYTLQEAQALTELPAGPTHEGLTFQEWNWDLADIKAENDLVDVGATYITDNGDTRIYLELTEERLDPYLGITGTGTVEVDWGDGSAKQTITNNASSIVKTQHIYPQKGSYMISLTPIQNATIRIAGSSGSYLIDDAEHTGKGIAYQFCLKKIELGKQVSFGGQNQYSGLFYNSGLELITIPKNTGIHSNSTALFQGSKYLKSCVFPKGWTKINKYCFNGVTNLKCVCIPKGVTTIDQSSFEGASSLKRLIIPNSVTSLVQQAIAYAYNLKKLKLPSGVNNISRFLLRYQNAIVEHIIPSNITSVSQQAFGDNANLMSVKFLGNITNLDSAAFQNCFGLKKLTFLYCTSVPTIQSNTIPTVDDLQIVVPDALYNDWIAASGWSTYASNIVKASEA